MRWHKTGRRPRAHRRARSDVLWWLAGFALLQVGLAASLERWRPELRDPEFGCKQALLKRRLAEEPGRPLFLVVGSSRTMNGLRPGLLEATPSPAGRPLVFNFGMTGCGPLQQLLAVRRLLREGVRPDWLVVEVTPSLLLLDLPVEQRFPADRLAWEDLPLLARYSHDAAGLYGRWFQARLVPWFGYRFRVLYQHVPGWVPLEQQTAFHWKAMDRDGWMCLGPITDPAEYARHLQRTREFFAPTLRGTQVTGEAGRALRELLGLCRAEGIPAALLLMPEGQSFRSWYTPASRAALDRCLAGLRGEFAVPLIDARDWVPAEEAFRDGHHLLAEGAALFTARFGREVVEPLTGGRGPASRQEECHALAQERP